MVRDGSAQPDSPTTRAGTPATVVLCGTGLTTTEPAAMRAQWPTSILPRIFAPAPIITPRPKKDDSAEVYIGEEFIGVIFVDEEEKDSYNFNMSILGVDLD